MLREPPQSVRRVTAQYHTVPGTPSWLRSRNDGAALDLLLSRGALTRNQVGALTGLSKPTASQMMQRLVSAGLIEVAGEVVGRRGPSATTYAVRGDAALGVAIDVSTEALAAVVVNATGAQYPVVDVELGRTAKGRSAAGDIRRAVRAACAAAAVPEGSIQAVHIGVQSAVNQRSDTLRFTSLLPGWSRKNVRSGLEGELGIAVTIENDVNLAAMAERALGRGADTAGFALLWLGEGLGLAVDVAGEIQRGVSGGAGEIGYLPVPRDAMAVDQEARDLQGVIGGPAITRLTRAAGAPARGYSAAIAKLRAASDVRSGIVAELAPRVAIGIVPVLAVLDPERIILSGPTAMACGDDLARAVANRLKRTTRWSPDIVAGGVGERPVLAGARTQLESDLRKTLFERLDRISP
jgi:predicted NBD/HSP70 family sugar kinase